MTQKPTIAAEKVADYVDANLSLPIVVSGFRAPEEILYFRERMAGLGKTFQVYFVDSERRLRLARLQSRGRPGDDVSAAEFANRDQQQMRMGLDRIRVETSDAKISNDGTLDEYFAFFENAVDSNTRDEINIERAIARLIWIRDIKLEDAILIGLLTAWNESETRPFFSTTQIASMINSCFPDIVPKHKDNVSRYFNQDFYAYFDIEAGRQPLSRRYRLSNTGYGMAVNSLRRLTGGR